MTKKPRQFACAITCAIMGHAGLTFFLIINRLDFSSMDGGPPAVAHLTFHKISEVVAIVFSFPLVLSVWWWGGPRFDQLNLWFFSALLLNSTLWVCVCAAIQSKSTNIFRLHRP